MGERRRSANGRYTAGNNRVPAEPARQNESNKSTGRVAPRPIRNVCVYCGSSPGLNPAYAATARSLGRVLAASGVGLVYGGGGLGLMGETAKAVLAHGGRVTGIIPEFLSERERMLRDVTELVVVEDMHERKKLMFDKSDAFVALPGGIGTLEELVEQLTWAQLGRHTKPIVLLNAIGFWAPFLALLGHMRTEGFIRPELAVPLLTVDKPEDVLPTILANALPPAEGAAEAVQEKF
jgi:uncharacterized protein (TIGR00730 family)